MSAVVRAHPVRGDEQPPKDWKAQAKEAELSDAAIERLAKDGFVVFGGPDRQVFDAYVHPGPNLPVFVTSDSILNAYHVLLSESLLRLEGIRSQVLGRTLAKILAAIPAAANDVKGPQPLIEEGRLRATRILGVAVALLGEALTNVSDADAAAIREEVAAIESGAGTRKPVWLGPPTPEFLAIDYSQFRPVGFNTRSSSLRRQFRACAWLQAVPMRISSDDEIAAAVILHFARLSAFVTEEEQDQTEAVAGCSWLEWVPHPLGRGLFCRGASVPYELEAATVAEFRAKVKEDGGSSDVNHVVASESAGAVLHVLEYAVLPDAWLFQQTAGAADANRAPNALEVCAMLGSSWARDQLVARSAGLAAPIDAARGMLAGNSVYEQHLRCLAALFEPLEAEVPALFKTEAWARKRCATVLASWAQERHAVALAAGETMQFFGELEGVPGFLEPVPEFFSRLSALCQVTSRTFAEQEKALGGTDAAIRGAREAMAADLHLLARAVADALPKGIQSARSLYEAQPTGDRAAFERAFGLIKESVPWARVKEGKFWQEVAERSSRIAKEFDDPSAVLDETAAAIIRVKTRPLGVLWAELHLLARRAQALAHKQLRGVPFSAEDATLFQGYGEGLARAMLYVGNSYLHPSDDAPRAAAVFADPSAKEHWIVGIGRPRRIYVLYPFRGRDYLCVGAVLPYLEARATSPLTDDEWRGRIDSTGDARPRPPEWARSLFPDD